MLGFAVQNYLTLNQIKMTKVLRSGKDVSEYTVPVLKQKIILKKKHKKHHHNSKTKTKPRKEKPPKP